MLLSRRWNHPLPLRLEGLEAREMPAVITFTGGVNASWHTAGNWDLGRVPAAGDDVVIPDIASVAAVTFSTGTTAVNSVTSASPRRPGRCPSPPSRS